jgi:hypothetical protein
MANRLQAVLEAIDAANRADPVIDAGAGRPRALLYGERMSARLAVFDGAASEALAIAVRAQHIERWRLPRETYPEGRIGYLRWRKDLQRHHASRAAAIMADAGYGADTVGRVESLILKRDLRNDAEAQTLEDVACLVFLEFEAPAFIAKHDDAKVRDILAKTAGKMSSRGLAAATELALDQRLSRLLREAVSGPA